MQVDPQLWRRPGESLFPFVKSLNDSEQAPPDARCPRCDAMSPGGYVTASGKGSIKLGWITGAPSSWRQRDKTLDSRHRNKPARWPGHRCPNCDLVWFEHPG